MFWFILILIFSIYIFAYFQKQWRIRSKLSWIPCAPGYPIIGSALDFKNSVDVLNNMLKYNKKYNGLYTLNIPNRTLIVVSDYELMEFILSSPEMITKSADYDYLSNWLGTGLLTGTGMKWKKRRRILTPAFHYSILEQFIEAMNSVGNILIEKLEKYVDQDVFDIQPYLTLYTLDVLCEATMGVSINALSKEESEYVASVKEMCRILLDRTFSALKNIEIFYRLSRDYRKELKACKVLHDFSNSVIQARRKELQNLKPSNGSAENGTNQYLDKTSKKFAFLDLLLQATIDGEPLSDSDISEEVNTFMFAGHDTTATSLGFILYLISRHREVQNKLFSELKEVLQDDKDRPILQKDMQEMKYLEIVIKESLRLYPVVPFIGRYADKDYVYKGNIIPEGATITPFIFACNRNPKYHKDPDTFRPERFEEMTGKNPFSNIPFSAGLRNCIGQKFAMLELKNIVAKLLCKYEFLPPENDEPLILASETVLKSVKGINCRLKKRH